MVHRDVKMENVFVQPLVVHDSSGKPGPRPPCPPRVLAIVRSRRESMGAETVVVVEGW